jgi:hypothetical protein
VKKIRFYTAFPGIYATKLLSTLIVAAGLRTIQFLFSLFLFVFTIFLKKGLEGGFEGVVTFWGPLNYQLWS